MTAELVRGQNHPLPHTRLEIRVTAGVPVLACATLADARGTVRDTEWTAHPGSPTLPGVEVSRQAATELRFHVDLEAVPEEAHQVSVLLALPEGAGGPARFGGTVAPYAAVTSTEGVGVAGFALTGLDAESAVVALELYRRQGGWKVRAVGQGYAGGLAELFGDQGLVGASAFAATVRDAVAAHMASAVQAPLPGPRDGARDGAQDGAQAGTAAGTRDKGRAGGIDYTHPARRKPLAPAAGAGATDSGRRPRPVAGDASGWSMDERLYNQVWGMFEDLARATAAYRSAVDFAVSRRDRELDQALADPRQRVGGAADAAREAARARHDDLVGQAREVLDRDLALLADESQVVEPALPPAYARWDSPVWRAYTVPDESPMALRLGEIHLPECPELQIPMLVRLPLERGLWVDSGRAGSEAAPTTDGSELRRLAMNTAVAHAARLLAVHPPGGFTVQVIDPAGSATAALAPIIEAGVLDGPPAAGAEGVSAVLGKLTQRVDLVRMALRGGAPESLPPDLDIAELLLIVNDFPHGFDDRGVTQLRYLADEGPSVGVHLLMVADREDAQEYGPVLDPLWRSMLPVTPVPSEHLADPWVGHTWTYEPPALPRDGGATLRRVLGEVGLALREARR